MVDFTKEFASLSPQQFVHDYLINLGVVHAVAGFDFSYGYKGAGHLDRLESDSGGNGDCHKGSQSGVRGRENKLNLYSRKASKWPSKRNAAFIGALLRNTRTLEWH